MQFERLEMMNFASYYGEHAIDLSASSDEPVVIILGGTGYGKTSIFDAINWALYGQDYEQKLKEQRERDILDYVNESALQDAHTNQRHTEMSCTLYFEHEGSQYYITQMIEVKPVPDDNGALKAVQTKRRTTLYEIQFSGNHKELKYSTIFLDEILPNNVKDYFLFDGDRIYNLSNPGASEEVRDAIYRVVDLELLKNAEAHLSSIAGEYRRKAKKEATGALSDIEKQYDEERERLAQLKQDLENLKKEEQSIRAQLEALEEKLKNLPDTSKLQGRRSELEKQLKRLETQSEVIKSDLRASAATAALAIAREPALHLMNLLDAKRQKGEIPKIVSQTLLKDLLKLKRCLCGTEFEEGDEIHLTLTARLEAEKAKKSSGQALLDLFMALGIASNLIEQATEQLNNRDQDLQDLDDTKREIQLALKEVERELDKLPKGDAANLNQEARKRRDALITNARKAQNVSDRIERCELRIKEYEKQRTELGKKQQEALKLQRRERLAQQAADEIEKIYEVFAEDSRRAVEQLTIQEFKRFVQSASEYSVALNEDYALEVLDSNGNRALQRLSMGQSQCLSLAFITAISRVSEKNPPLVIDMPFSRLDRNVHHSVSARLPEITSQLILFLIPDTEWNDVTAANLRNKASHIHQLEFDKNVRQTQIING
ncbi:MAG: hypothetical protein B6243_01755 [Anaerolineaceae bacterium 4572_5.2]|nr:MAG: hypothetical protein B6243_01755 [Anaerolineaceae bacterium 4572_5.2]